MSIKDLAEKNRDYIIEKRRYYHMHPELSMEEFETTKSIVKDLADIGITAHTFKNGFQGCIGEIKGSKPGKTIMLRSDIDALSVSEKTGLPFASKNEGKMHACGHDSHISMLLGAAKILFEIKDQLSGTVKILFQPAEEVAKGAKGLVEQGVCDNVDAVYGIHIWSTIDAPKINMSFGERMASADLFSIDIKGYAAHGSAPDLGHDAVVAASAVIMAIQTVVSRLNSPLNPLVVSIGKINSGMARNIISDHAVMEGTTRTFDRVTRGKLKDQMTNIVENVCKAYGCTGTLKYDYMTGPIINDHKDLVDIAQNAVIKLYGKEGLCDMEKITGAEDFSFYMEKVPSIFGFIGARSKDVPGSEKSNHHECFTPDERSLERGAAVAAQFAYDFLNNSK